MARHASAVKAARQSLKKRAHNINVKSECKTAVKKIRLALAKKITNKEEAKKELSALLNQCQKTLMKAASKNILKIGTVSRQVSRLSSAIHQATI